MNLPQLTLKQSQIKETREEKLKEQEGVCPLCETEILPHEATLDHCHETGYIRRVLHRSCNSAEGRILAFAGKRSRGSDPELFVRNTLKYWEADYSGNPLHPKHGKPKPKRRRKARPKVKKSTKRRQPKLKKPRSNS